MKKTRLQNISDLIYQSLVEVQNIQEEQVHILFDGLIDLIQESGKVKIPDESKTLFRWLQDMWQYRDFGQLSQEASFLMGSIWGAVQIVEVKQKRLTESEDINALVNKYQNYYWLFASVAKTPGIKHKNLSKQGGKSPSELSQFISRMESENLLTYSRTGREKYYYLQERGRKVYEGIKEKQKQASVIDAGWEKQMAKDNDCVDKEVEVFAGGIAFHAELLVDNTIHDEMYNNIRDILKIHFREIVRDLQLLYSLYDRMGEEIYNKVVALPAENNVSYSYNNEIYPLRNVERYEVAEC